MTDRFHIRIANPLGDRPLKVEPVEPAAPCLVEELDKCCVVLKNEFDVMALIGKVNKARIQVEKEAARQSFLVSTIFREAFRVINLLAWRLSFKSDIGPYYCEMLRKAVDEAEKEYCKRERMI